MAWASAHFAVGMAGGAAIGAALCLTRRGGWRYLPVAMTLGGLWALGPDLPRLFTEGLPQRCARRHPRRTPAAQVARSTGRLVSFSTADSTRSRASSPCTGWPV